MREHPSSSPDPSSAHADPARWAELIQSLKPAAMLVVIDSTMSKKLRQHCSPEDIWQETLERAWRARAQHEWRGAAAFRAWLFEIARNRVREVGRSLATVKRGGGRAPLRFSELGSTASASMPRGMPADSQTPSRIVARGEQGEAMRKALSELPPDVEEIVRLYHIEGLTMELIAKRLDIGVSAAWRRYRKGSEVLARIFPNWARDSSSRGS